MTPFAFRRSHNARHPARLALALSLALIPAITVAEPLPGCTVTPPPPAEDPQPAGWRGLPACGAERMDGVNAALAAARGALGDHPVLRVAVFGAGATVIHWDSGSDGPEPAGPHLATLRLLRTDGAWAVTGADPVLDGATLWDPEPNACMHEVTAYPAWLPPLAGADAPPCGAAASADAAEAQAVATAYLVGGWDRRAETFGAVSDRMRRELADQGVTTPEGFMARFHELRPLPPAIRRTELGSDRATVTTLFPWRQEGYAGLNTVTIRLLREGGRWVVDDVAQ